jgi:predicted nucleotide-binding protein (sugar kinase/HSP70/actin superfamily)
VTRVTYAHFGLLYISIEHYLRSLGLEPVTPPLSSRRTLDLGVRHCPEMTCAPCKLLFGNYCEGLERGAEHLVLFGGADTCRLGYLAGPQAERLREAGYEFIAHTVNPRTMAADTLRITREITDPSPRAWIEAARTLIASQTIVDEIEQLTFALRPHERERGTATRLHTRALEEVRACHDRSEIQAKRERILAPLRSAPRDSRRRVFRIALVGDPYSISEPFFNMNLERELGHLGVEVDRWFWIGRGLRLPSLEEIVHRGDSQARSEDVAPYLGRDVGGFALPSLREAMSFLRKGVDGLVHLAPFSCTPEIVAASVLPRMARDHGVPLLALSFDEQSGQTGLVTRLEAFVDLLDRRAWHRERR